MIPNFKEILAELSYRVDGGIPDLTKESHVNQLIDILRENGISDAAHLAQKARVYFSYLNEASSKDPKLAARSKDSGKLIYFGSKETKDAAIKKGTHEDPIKPKQQSQPKKGKKLSGSDYELDIEKDTDSSQPNSANKKNPKEIKPEIDRISIEAGESRKGFYTKGYHKSESEEDAGAAPGNAGSMLNENGSCDVCEWALENGEDNLLRAVGHLYGNLKGGSLLEAEDKRGIAGQKDKVPSVSARELRDFRMASKGKFDNLSDGQLSRLMIAANGGLIKARKIKEGIAANGWREEDCIVNGFFGDAGGKSQQMDMVRQSNKIFGPDGTEVPKNIALKLVAAGGGGANPSDTSQFTYNQKTGDLMIKFTSDKDSFDAIVAQSSLQKESSIKAAQIDDLVKEGKVDAKVAETSKKFIEAKTKELASIEAELKTVGAEPARKMLKMPVEDVIAEFKTLSGGANPEAYYDGVLKKYMGKPFNAQTEEEAVTKFLKFSAMSPEEQDAFAEKTGSKSAKFTSKEAEVIGRLKTRFGLDPLVAKKIDDIRKRSVAVERDILDKLNKIKVPVEGGKVGLGDYMDAKNFIDKFHMAGAMGDKHGVFAYPGLFEVVCGVGVINDNIISDCMNTKNMDDFIRKFGSTKEEFQLSKENQITGSVRIAYFLNDKGQKIRIGEKRQRSKTGATGRFNTVYKWDKDTIGCFKRKNGLA
jgi:hypothetical protein